MTHDKLIADAAREIHDAMRWAADNAQTSPHPVWCDGNSFAELEARDSAAAALAPALAEIDRLKGAPGYYQAPAPQGCICPPTSEKTCQANFCPRKPMPSATGIQQP